MNSSEYRGYNAINNSALADFYLYGENKAEAIKESYDFWLGKCFEGYIRQKYDKLYTLPYFPIENMNKRIIKAIIDGSDLDNVVRYNKDKSIHKADQDIGRQIAIIKGDKRSPIDKEDFELIETTTENLLTMPVLDDLTVNDFFEHAEFDVPVVWKDESGHECKALFDVVSTLETDDGQNISLVFDLKYYANQYGFFKMFRNKLWIQERHYTRALKYYCLEKGSTPYYCMPFLVGYKDSGLTQVNMIDDESIDRADDKYYDLFQRYVSWVDDGKEESGHFPIRYLKVY